MDRDAIIENLRRRVDSLERSAALGLLVSAVVHEVNNPLSVILIGADTLRHGGIRSENVQRHLDVLNNQADRIIHITRRMQELTRRNLAGGENVDLCQLLTVFADLEEVFADEQARQARVAHAEALDPQVRTVHRRQPDPSAALPPALIDARAALDHPLLRADRLDAVHVHVS